MAKQKQTETEETLKNKISITLYGSPEGNVIDGSSIEVAISANPGFKLLPDTRNPSTGDILVINLESKEELGWLTKK